MAENPKTTPAFEHDWNASVSFGEVLAENKDGTVVIRISGCEATLKGRLVKRHFHGGADAEHRFEGPVEVIKAVEVGPSTYKMAVLPALLMQQIQEKVREVSRVIPLPTKQKTKRA